MKARFLTGSVAVFVAGAILVAAPRAGAQQASGVVPRIVQAVSDSNLVTIPGSVHPLARAQYDRGAVADSQPIRRGLLLLQRSPDQETALRTLLDNQQTKSSPSFHQWLTPQQFGQQFGPADADIQTITSWLTSHGFQVNRISAGRTVIEFSGNAGQVRNAFHTEIHQYVVNGEQHLANASPVQIPAALAPVVAGPVTLHNFPRKPLSRMAGVFSKNRGTGQVSPLYTFSNSSVCGATDCNALGPGDFAAIYNLSPLWHPASGTAIDGTGQTIAIVGDSDICTANSPDYSVPTSAGGCGGHDDVANFRSLFGLPANAPNVIVDGPNPGLNPDETEGDLDVQWSGAVAKNATIDFVTAEDTEVTAGTDLAAEYIVDNNLAPVLSESFGYCEPFLLTAGNQFESALWEQAAAQGITVVVSAGDSGSAGCDNDNLFPNVAEDGPFVNGIASTPFNVATGGTDFDITATNYQNTYWSGGNTTVNGINDVSATKYIPETTWNDTCAQSLTGSLSGLCDPPANIGYVSIVGGGGGQSNCTQAVEHSNGSVSCTGGGYAKPAWQGGPYVTGQASTDGVRDLPDVSLFAADGFVSNSFYIVCESDLNVGDASCNLNTLGPYYYFDFVGVGGTSSAAPTFAGMMALVNENMAVNHTSLPAKQGNANYVLYALANNQASLSCNSTTGPSSTCTFNDITRGNNSVPCAGESAGCSNQTNTGSYGFLEEENAAGDGNGTLAFNAGTAFDMASGLGTVNAANLVNNWPGIVGNFTGTTTKLCLSTTATTLANCMASPINITHGQTVYVYASVAETSNSSTAPSNGTNPENIALIGTSTGGSASVNHFVSNNYVISNIGFFPLSGGTESGSTTNLVGGTYTVTAHYTGDGKFGASDSTPGISVTVAPEPSETVVSFLYPPANAYLASGSAVTYGVVDSVRVDICALRSPTCLPTSPSGQIETAAAGTVTLMDNGSPIVNPNDISQSVFTLNTEGFAEDQTAFLAPGQHSFVAQYTGGDPSYSASLASNAFLLTVNQAPAFPSVAPSSTNVTTGGSIGLSAFVDTESFGSVPTGTVAFCTVTTSPCPAGNLLGTLGLVPATLTGLPTGTDANGYALAQTTGSLNVVVSANETIYATYSGNTNYLAETSAGVGITAGPYFTLSLMGAPGTTQGFIPITTPGGSATQVYAVSGSAGYTGTVNLACSVVSVAPLSVANDVPTCSFSSNSITGSGQSTLTVKTTAVSEVGPGSDRQRPGPMPNWPAAYELASIAGACALLVIAARKRRSLALMAAVLVMAATATISCSSPGPVTSTTESGNSTGNAGTTEAEYTLTVTATPTSGGSSQQVAITLIVGY